MLRHKFQLIVWGVFALYTQSEAGSSYAPNPSQMNRMNPSLEVLILSISHSKWWRTTHLIFQYMKLGAVLDARKGFAFLTLEKNFEI